MATKTLSPDDVLEAISSWTVLDLANFNKAFSEKFGVTAAAPVAVVSAAAGGGLAAAPVEEAEQTEFAVILTAAGDAKIAVIKAVREITGLGLKEAKDLVDAAPKPVKEGVSKEEAERVLKQLQEAGASGEVK